MADHACPYGAERLDNLPGYINPINPCGGNGWLCHRCREDRADARNREQIEAVRAMRDADAQIGRLMKRLSEVEDELEAYRG